MQIYIDGLDITSYIAYGGIKWTRNDIDAPDAGRTMDGVMHRGRVATKIKLEITTTPLKTADLRTLLNAIYPEYVEVTYDDPMEGSVVKLMYSNNNPATFCMVQPNGDEWWKSISFPLVEV